MKKLLLIPFLFLGIVSFSQTRKLLGIDPNGIPGVIYNDTINNSKLNILGAYILTPSDSSLLFDSSKVVTDITLNVSSDSIQIFKGGVYVRSIKLGSSAGGTLTGGSIAWPGTIYATPTTGTVNGGTLTFSPTLTIQSANTILAGPTSGTGTPTFRALSANDIPALSESQITNLASDLAGKQGALILTTTGTSGAATLIGNALNIPNYASGGGGGSGWLLTGNASTDSAANFLGTTDVNPINFRVNGALTAKISAGKEIIKYGGLAFGGNGGESGLKIIGSNSNTVPGISLKSLNASGKNIFIGSSIDGSAIITDSIQATTWSKFYSDHSMFQNDISSMTGNHYVLGSNGSGVDALWLGISRASAGLSNYAMFSDGSSTFINSSSGDIYFRKANATQVARQWATTGDWLFQNGTIGAGTAYNNAVHTDMSSAIVQMNTINQGFLPPRLTTAQIATIPKTVTSVIITSGGTGYGNTAITFTGGGGSGAAGSVLTTGGVITGVSITSWGTGYTSAPTLTVANGSGAVLTATTGQPAGLTLYCTDCTATDGSTGVMQTYNGTSWKNNW